MHNIVFLRQDGTELWAITGTGISASDTTELTGKLIGFKTALDASSTVIVGIQPIIDTTVDCNDSNFQFGNDYASEVHSTAVSTDTLTYKYFPNAAHHCIFSVTGISGLSFVTVVEDTSRPTGESFLIQINSNSPSQMGSHTLSVDV